MRGCVGRRRPVGGRRSARSCEPGPWPTLRTARLGHPPHCHQGTARRPGPRVPGSRLPRKVPGDAPRPARPARPVGADVPPLCPATRLASRRPAGVAARGCRPQSLPGMPGSAGARPGRARRQCRPQALHPPAGQGRWLHRLPHCREWGCRPAPGTRARPACPASLPVCPACRPFVT